MRSGVERFALIVVLIFAVSCSASKQNGFSYRPAYTGPDVSGSAETAGALEDQPAIPTLSHTLPATLDQSEEANIITGDMVKIVEQNINEGKVDARKAVTDIAGVYAKEHNVQLTPKQLRKLDKYAAKLEKKQQKRADVEWGPKNNLEIFLLAAAGVGLVVGFFSAIGWFVFLVAALVYLYLKLLKD